MPLVPVHWCEVFSPPLTKCTLSFRRDSMLPNLLLMHPLFLWTEGVSILKTFHYFITKCEPTIESLLSFERITLFVFRRKEKFLILLFVISVGNDTWEEPVVLLGKLRIMFLSTERPPLQILISGPMFSDITLEFIELSLLRGIIRFWSNLLRSQGILLFCQAEYRFTLITNPRCCNRKVNVFLSISNSFFDAAISKISSR